MKYFTVNQFSKLSVEAQLFYNDSKIITPHNTMYDFFQVSPNDKELVFEKLNRFVIDHSRDNYSKKYWLFLPNGVIHSHTNLIGIEFLDKQEFDNTVTELDEKFFITTEVYVTSVNFYLKITDYFELSKCGLLF